MTAMPRDLSAPEPWQRSLERSRRRRIAAPKLRRQAVRRRRASTALAASMLVGPGTQLAAAQPSDPGPGQPNIASESSANRAIGGEDQARFELKLGSAGKAVAAVQRRLNLEATGYFGTETKHKVRDFQQDEGLKDDGIVGPETWKALFSPRGGVGPAASPGSTGSSVGPAVSGAGQPQVDFAVRRASDSELEKHDLNGALPKPQANEAGLVAIELRTTADQGGEGSSNEAEPLGTSDAGTSSNAPSGGRSASGSESGNTQPTTGNNTQPTTGGNTQPDTTPQPSAGSCATSLSHPLPSPYNSTSYITSGYRTSSRPSHAGIDIGAPSGTPLRAAACGIITYYSWASGYGNYVCIKHTSTFTTCYAHLSRFADLRVGSYVTTGQLLGYVTRTGHSTGPHPHFEVRSGLWGADTNPYPYLYSGRTMSGTPVSTAIGGPDLILDEQSDQRTATATASEDVAKISEPNLLSVATNRSEPSTAGDESSTDPNTSDSDKRTRDGGALSESSEAILSDQERGTDEAPELGPSENASPVAQEATSKQSSASSAPGQGGGPSENASLVAKDATSVAGSQTSAAGQGGGPSENASSVAKDATSVGGSQTTAIARDGRVASLHG